MGYCSDKLRVCQQGYRPYVAPTILLHNPLSLTTAHFSLLSTVLLWMWLSHFLILCSCANLSVRILSCSFGEKSDKIQNRDPGNEVSVLVPISILSLVLIILLVAAVFQSLTLLLTSSVQASQLVFAATLILGSSYS